MIMEICSEIYYISELSSKRTEGMYGISNSGYTSRSYICKSNTGKDMYHISKSSLGKRVFHVTKSFICVF
jgi:hypothetical protein